MLMRSEPSTIDLAGVWRLREAAGDHEPVAMPLPGDAISALRDAGRIPDPYVGRNEYDVRWVAERDWIVSRNFELAGGDTDGWYLDIDGLDEPTLADRLALVPGMEERLVEMGREATKVALCRFRPEATMARLLEILDAAR